MYIFFTAKGSPVDDELCYSLLLSYISDNTKQLPLELGDNLSNKQRDLMADYLIKKHLLDYKSTHCTPLPTDYFRMPWSVPKPEL